MAAILLTLAILLCAITFYGWKTSPYRRMPKGKKRLPGPRGIPFIGRIHDVPSVQTWLKFYEWTVKYGPIYKQEIFGTTHVWISDENIALELLGKKGAIYSDRPTIPNLPDNKYSGAYLPLMGRNDKWARQRKFAHQILPSSLATPSYQPTAFYPMQERSLLLHRLLQDPSSYIAQIEAYSSRIISRWSWGTSSIAPTLREVTMALLISISPSGVVTNVISWLTLLPEWASPWKKEEAKRRVVEEKFFREAFDEARAKFEIGKAGKGEGLRDCFARTYFENLEIEKASGKRGKAIAESDEEALSCIGMMAIAGALTIGSPLQTFLLAMLEYPEWQAKLHEEIDQVCGGRVPDWEDRTRMPLLRAVVKEVCRWRAAVPTGIPHSLEQDDTYQDYFIPANSTIHAFEHAFTLNADLYPSPHLFNPGRWLDPSFPTYKEPLSIHPTLKGYHQFGHGRRTCQGVEIVEQELFLGMGGMAWAFNIIPKSLPSTTNSCPTTRPETEDTAESQIDNGRGGRLGKEKLPYTSLLIAKPVEFSGEFELKVRSRERGIQIIENAVEAIREEGREVIDGAGLFDCGVEVAEETEGLVGLVRKKVEMISRVEMGEETGKLEFSKITFEEEKRVVSDGESLILLNECWGKR